MRVVAAALFVLIGLFLGSVLLDALGLLSPRSWLAAPLMFGWLALVAAAALWLFNAKATDPFGRLSPEQRIAQLERLGLIVDEAFEATRAFGVGDPDAEGPSYYLELIDGRVLFLTGQYLFDFEPLEADGHSAQETARPRRFPNTSFVVRRHRKAHYVTDIVCRGAVLEPEVMTPSFSRSDWKQKRVHADGAVITTPSYDELKRERLASASR